ncbi:hypothetical protein QFC21_006343 [Naganishia friedmannii]|uniref:Uncharacterized protein n=1 Tax=Naganishia friedmannii TaxID=89922 RepID=A0ACC2V516_9TREE|nr:hypothetical protein QFC21_006343 [Naganishia friedmannii]
MDGEDPDKARKRVNRERQRRLRARRAEPAAAEAEAAQAAQRAAEINARGRGRGRGRGSGGGGRGGGAGRGGGVGAGIGCRGAPSAGRSGGRAMGRAVDDGRGRGGRRGSPAASNNASSEQGQTTFLNSDGAAEKGDPSNNPGRAADGSTPFSNWSITPDPQRPSSPLVFVDDSQQASASAAATGTSHTPQYGLDFARFRISDVTSKRLQAMEIIERLQEHGMAERTTDSVVDKIDDCWRRSCQIADMLRNRTGEGVIEETTASIDLTVNALEMLAGDSNGKIYLQLRDVLADRHGVHPLALHESTAPVTQSSREDTVRLMLRGLPDDEPTTDEDAPGEIDLDFQEGREGEDREDIGEDGWNDAEDYGEEEEGGNGYEGKTAYDTSKPRTTPALERTLRNLDDRHLSQTTPADFPPPPKGKERDEIGSTIGDGFSIYQETVSQHDAKKEERLAKKQKFFDEKLELEKVRDKREAAKHKLELEETERVVAEVVRQRHANQVREFLGYIDLDFGLELSGELAFATQWDTVKPRMERIVANRQAAQGLADRNAVGDGEEALKEQREINNKK